MRIATVRDPAGGTRIWIAGSDGELYFDIAAHLESGDPRLTQLSDVGSLYRAGASTVAYVRQQVEVLGLDPSAGRHLEALDLAPPVIRPESIVCVGRNYRAHVEEGDAPYPEFPVLFSKFPNSLLAHNSVVIRPSITTQLDYEGELAVIIGRTAKHLTRTEAMSYVAGYTVLNDISARDLQLGDVQWIRGKSLDTFCPIGPIFVSADEISDVSTLRIQTRVNDELRQDATVAEMIFPIPDILAFITEAITLQPGDIIATGTPSGTAIGMKPPVWLEVGDTINVTIAGLGNLQSTIGIEQ